MAALLDGARGSGNQQIHVTSRLYHREMRMVLFGHTLDEDSETLLLKHIINVPGLEFWHLNIFYYFFKPVLNVLT